MWRSPFTVGWDLVKHDIFHALIHIEKRSTIMIFIVFVNLMFVENMMMRVVVGMKMVMMMMIMMRMRMMMTAMIIVNSTMRLIIIKKMIKMGEARQGRKRMIG